MTRTLIDIDDDALAAAAEELGATRKVDTMNRALCEIAARTERLKLLEWIRGAESNDLGAPEVLDNTWR